MNIANVLSFGVYTHVMGVLLFCSLGKINVNVSFPNPQPADLRDSPICVVEYYSPPPSGSMWRVDRPERDGV